jgi:protease II
MDLVMLLRNLSLGAGFIFVSLAMQAQTAAPPVTEKRPVTDVYHGVKVVDDYRWLENFADPKVKAWVAGENEYTRSVLSKFQARAKASLFS